MANNNSVTREDIKRLLELYFRDCDAKIVAKDKDVEDLTALFANCNLIKEIKEYWNYIFNLYRLYPKEHKELIPVFEKLPFKEKKDVLAELFLILEHNELLSDNIDGYEIARRINANENVDLNNVNRIKVQCGIDIIKIAEEIKRDTSKKED